MKLRVIISIVILFTVLLILLPKPSGEATLHIASGSMMMCVVDLQKSISESLETNAPINSSVNNKCPSLISAMRVDDHGRIIMQNSRHGISMVLEPVRIDTEIKWSCRGTPQNSITPLCRQINEQTQPGNSVVDETATLPPE